METAMISKPGKVGLQLPALIRNVLLADCGLDWGQACIVADAIQDRIKEADWIELDNGTTLEVAWTPNGVVR
jgi:hypothetical protein